MKKLIIIAASFLAALTGCNFGSRDVVVRNISRESVSFNYRGESPHTLAPGASIVLDWYAFSRPEAYAPEKKVYYQFHDKGEELVFYDRERYEVTVRNTLAEEVELSENFMETVVISAGASDTAYIYTAYIYTDKPEFKAKTILNGYPVIVEYNRNGNVFALTLK